MQRESGVKQVRDAYETRVWCTRTVRYISDALIDQYSNLGYRGYKNNGGMSKEGDATSWTDAEQPFDKEIAKLRFYLEEADVPM